MCRASLVLVLALLALPSAAGAVPADPSAPSVWTRESGRLPATSGGARMQVSPDRYAAFSLDAAGFEAQTGGAPRENTRAAAQDDLPIVAIPAPDGTLQRFKFVRSPVMAPALARTVPGGFESFAGYGVTDPTASVRFDISRYGFQASVRSDSGSWYVDPAYRQRTSRYVSYYGRDLDNIHGPLRERDIADLEQFRPSGRRAVPTPGAFVIQRTYRLALASDDSYAAFHSLPADNAATVDAKVTAAKGVLVNRLDQIYNDDLAVKMVLVPNNNLLNFNTAAAFTAAYTAAVTDCYSPNDQALALDKNQTVVDNKIGTANYDIGHLMFGEKGDGGGVAFFGVGEPAVKAKACTGLADPVGDNFAIDYVAHEMGHQFGGPHTFNGQLGSCNGNREAGSAVEPGSGITIMGYAGICAADNTQQHSDPYFSQQSIEDIQTFILDDPLHQGAPHTTLNRSPVVTAPAAKTIPKQTPFTLTGFATDEEEHPLVYLWEQNDTGSAGQLLSNTKSNGPLFRVFSDVATQDGSQSPAPGQHNATTTDVSRTFPDMTQIAANNTNAAAGTCPASNVDCFSEFLPTSARTLHFRLTARDRYPAGGGASPGDVAIAVSGTAGPFLLTSQSSEATVTAGAPLQLTWNVASTSGAPISVADVRISFSADGGVTFPIEVVATTANDGTESITVPNFNTTDGRFKVEAIGNYFFDITDADTTITGGAATVTPTATSTTVPTPTVDPADTPEPTVTSTATGTATATSTATATATSTSTATATATSTATSTATATATGGGGGGGTPTPTATSTLTAVPSAFPTASPTASPTAATVYVPRLGGSRRPRAKRNNVKLRVACKPKAAGLAVPATCDGAIKLVATIAGEKQTIGSKSFSLAQGAAKNLKVKISAAARDALPLKAKAKATVGTEQASRKIRIRPPL